MQVFAYHIRGNSVHILFPCLPSTAQLKIVARIWCSSLLQQGVEFLLSCITAMQATQVSLQLDRTGAESSPRQLVLRGQPNILDSLSSSYGLIRSIAAQKQWPGLQQDWTKMTKHV